MEDDLAHVVGRERLLHELQVRNDPELLLSLLHQDFREYGASGRLWTRDTIAGATSGQVCVAATEMQARRLGPDAVLVTYRSEAAGRRALRSSVWVRVADGWLLLFHQGTPVEGR